MSRLRRAVTYTAIAGIIGAGVVGSLGIGYIAAPAVVATSGGGLTVTGNQVGLTTSCSTGERLEWDGSAWQCRSVNDYRSKHFEWTNEFVTSNSGNDFTGAVSGTGASNSTIAGLGRPGVLDQMTGTTNTGLARMNTNSAHPFTQSAQVLYEWTGGVPVLSTSGDEYTLMVGLISDVGVVNQNNGCYFMYDRGNVATGGPNSGNADKWSCWCADNGTRTKFLMASSGNSDESFALGDGAIAAATLPNTNIYTLKIVVTGTTRAEFYRNGTKVCNINTNLPSSDIRGTIASVQIIKSAGTTSMHAYSDRMRYAIDLTAARSP